MTSAYRFQVRRTRGWRKPAGGVLVTRSHSRYANPFTVAEHGRDEALRRYEIEVVPTFDADRLRADLAGRPLGCWCRLDQRCHADILLRLANGTPSAACTGSCPGAGSAGTEFRTR